MNVYFLFSWCWSPFLFDFLSVLVVRGGAVCLPTPPSWFSPLSVLKTAVQTDPHPLQDAHSWVSESPSSHSSSLHQDLECAVLSLHLMTQGNMGRVTPGHGGVQGGTRPKRMTPLYILQRSRSLKLNIPGDSSAPSISHKYVLG